MYINVPYLILKHCWLAAWRQTLALSAFVLLQENCVPRNAQAFLQCSLRKVCMVPGVCRGKLICCNLLCQECSLLVCRKGELTLHQAARLVAGHKVRQGDGQKSWATCLDKSVSQQHPP